MEVHGYTYGTHHVSTSPVSMEDFESMKKSVLFGEEDVEALRKSYDIVEKYKEEILDVWYGFIGSQPHLLASFKHRNSGKPIEEYLGGVRKRFGQWILDTARGNYDQHWLNYQHEIGLRHHRQKKNQTDNISSSDIVPFRDLVALVFPVTFTLKPFLAMGDHSPEEIEKMYTAWIKSCLLQVTLWSHPYVKEGDF